MKSIKTLLFTLALNIQGVICQDLSFINMDTNYMWYHDPGAPSGWELKDSILENGKVYIYFDTDTTKIMKEVSFKNYKYDGEFLVRYKNGELYLKRFYKQGLFHGYSDYYPEKGGLVRTIFDNGKVISSALYDEDGNILNFRTETDNEIISFSVHPNGHLARIYYTIDNQPRQKYYVYHPNGVIKEEGGYKRDSITVYYDSGEIHKTINKNEDGFFLIKEFYENGSLKKFTDQSHRSQPIDIEYHEDGSIKLAMNKFNENGNYDGEFIQYDKNGKIELIFIYKDGELIDFK